MNRRWLFLPALSAVLGAAAQPAPAFDTCFDYCINQPPYCLSSVTQEQQNCRDNCQQMCSPGGVLYNKWNSASPAAPYGAIAYGAGSGAPGWAYNQDSASKAAQVALANCAQHGDDCKIAIRLTHSCGAVATGVGGTVIARAGKSQQEAQQAVLSACRIRAGKSCAIQAWTCSP